MSFLSVCSSEDLNEEKEIQTKLNKLIDGGKSFIFETGAGAGKTYALMECLKHLLSTQGNIIKEYRQNILCITYTNVAADNIKLKLGNSEIVQVSTIHDKIWDIISPYQEQLMEIHVEKLKEEVVELSKLISNDNLHTLNTAEFVHKIMENRDFFYKYYKSDAAQFRDAFKPIVDDFDANAIRNVNNFKNFVNNIIKVEDKRNALDAIDNNTKLNYNARFNRDVKHKMLISHDSLLEYGYLIIKASNMLKRIIIDKNPIIFIDEFQDTNEYVLNILNELHEYSIEKHKKLIIGFFGDPYQKIYSSGIGCIDNNNYLTSAERVYKKYNRRSSREVIEICNKIRASDKSQESIYTDCDGGIVRFYKGNLSSVDNFITELKTTIGLTKENKLTCLLLTNRQIAANIKIDKIYDFYLNTDRYSGANFDNLNQELLQSDKIKLGVTQRLLYNIIEFKVLSESSDTYFKDIISINKISIKYYSEYLEFLKLLKKIKGTNLLEYICSIFSQCKDSKNEIMRSILEDRISFNFRYEGVEDFEETIIRFFVSELYNEEENESENVNTANVIEFLNNDISVFIRWYNYVNNNQNEDIEYYTFHSTKGLEFQNVVLVMGNAFGRDRSYFDFYFKNLDNYDELNDMQKNKMDDIRNLLYVACSRAIKKLFIYYVDDISTFQNGIISIFGEINEHNLIE